MRAINQRNWFEDDELEPCPRCHERLAVISPDVGAIVCIECGLVGFRRGGPEHGLQQQPAV